MLDLLGGSEQTRIALDLMGYDPDSRLPLVEVSTHTVVEIDAQRQQRSVICRSIWEARSDGVRGVPEVFELVKPGDPMFEFSALAGCSIGATHQDIDKGVYGYELLFERPLQKGESAITEYLVNIPPGADQSDLFELVLNETLAEAVLWLRFDARRIPARCEVYTGGVDGEMLVRALRPARSVHASAQGSRARRLGIRWEW